MKLYLLVAGLILSTSVFAQDKKDGLLYQADRAVTGQKYGSAGCGLGSVIIGGGSGFNQIFAATSNGTSGNQTFGISSGTSNCEGANGARSSNDAVRFAAANRQQLEVDIAQANGEALASLTTIMGCKDTQLVGTRLQSKLGNMPVKSASDAEMGALIVNSIALDPELGGTCSI